MKNKEILLIDGNSLLFKAYYGTHKMLENKKGFNSKGEPVNALRAFSLMILKLQQIFQTSEAIFVAFDSKEKKTYRHQYDFYKANRKGTPNELILQIPMVYKFLKLYGIIAANDPYNEADDLIGIIADKAKKNDYIVNIVTTDYDFLQLVDENVTVYLAKKGVQDLEEFNISNFARKFNNLSPVQIPDFKSIAGDKSDNILGIKGIGPQGAIKLLNYYNNLETLLLNLDQLPKNLSKKIEEQKELALRDKKLATIKIKDQNFKFELDDFFYHNPKDIKALIDFFTKKEVFSLAERFKKIFKINDLDQKN
ncbi:/ polA / DNA polymerase I /:504654 Reverse [Candidatus Hepatoplasma crinochetorum]|uniref:5'-3' exonuclease n=1 Tax=Candidatus Hepatoplasma crinochetorum TaxID=295596 RepID=A0A0G7ZN39_9MOLU|nr:/ polA / DNA polymerase I /:504654 Reverse [Candidatus Hepatoplasma crinochetorum]